MLDPEFTTAATRIAECGNFREPGRGEACAGEGKEGKAGKAELKKISAVVHGDSCVAFRLPALDELVKSGHEDPTVIL